MINRVSLLFFLPIPLFFLSKVVNVSKYKIVKISFFPLPQRPKMHIK